MQSFFSFIKQVTPLAEDAQEALAAALQRMDLPKVPADLQRQPLPD